MRIKIKKCMKKIILMLLTFITVNPLTAEDLGIEFKARVAAFFPFSSLFSNIYGNCMPCYELEASTKFFRRFEAWVNYDWLSEQGESYKRRDYTSITLENCSLGIKYPYQMTNCLSTYIGIGPSFGKVRVNNHYNSEHEKLRKHVFGCVVKVGGDYSIGSHLFIDLFFDYLYEPSGFITDADLGGGKLGLGLGYKF